MLYLKKLGTNNRDCKLIRKVVTEVINRQFACRFLHNLTFCNQRSPLQAIRKNSKESSKSKSSNPNVYKVKLEYFHIPFSYRELLL